MKLYAPQGGALAPLPPDAPAGDALWIDLFRPLPEQIAALAALGIEVPTLEDMEEIEISNRLYREGAASYMTAVLPGLTPEGDHVSGPVTFILMPERLVTVRHHTPRPFETFPARACKSSTGCGSADRLFLGLIEDIIARLADLLEHAGRVIDTTSTAIFSARDVGRAQLLQEALESVGRQAELMARVRLGLLTLERVLGFYTVGLENHHEQKPLRGQLKEMLRDVQALEVHLDFLSGRVGLAVDTTLGLINLEQNNTVRILSVVAALFLPPTLIASVYGMNFAHMPELGWRLGYPMALGLMVGSAVVTYAFIKWKKWI
ncbi:MAG: magnesium transporter CorA family protein [Paracoccus sp. (in: a-proteobacteria)]|nr:magnesium transporter CorA family protein [Paracoccus sp. (in: a-proteobacteria)]